jgi:hypothetical protein
VSSRTARATQRNPVSIKPKREGERERGGRGEGEGGGRGERERGGRGERVRGEDSELFNWSSF